MKEVIKNGMDIASALRSALADRIGEDRFHMWFDAEVSLDCVDGTLRVAAAEQFQLDNIRRRFAADLEVVCYQVCAMRLEIDYQVDPSLAGLQAADDLRPVVPMVTASPAKARLAPATREAEFLPFIVSEENRTAHTAVQNIFTAPGRTTPLFIYGPTGSGKSHLLETIKRQAYEGSAYKRIVSVSAEQFTTQFLEALQGSGLPNFRRKFRSVELLLIDDLQFFSGKRSTIVELQNTIDIFLRERRQLVLTADRPPADLVGIGQDLKGRMSGGVVCQVVYPDLPTRRKILKQLAGRSGNVPDDVIDLLAERIQGDVRPLTGALNLFTAHQQAHGGTLTMRETERALDDLFDCSKRIVRLNDIQQAVCSVFGLDKEALQSSCKEKQVTHPRMLAMWLARKHTRAGLSEICRFFGRRSHSTVVSAERNVDQWVHQGAAIRISHGECPVEDAIRRVELKLRTG